MFILFLKITIGKYKFLIKNMKVLHIFKLKYTIKCLKLILIILNYIRLLLLIIYRNILL